jgi:hypothetical protein
MGVAALLAPAAQLIEPDRGERAHKGKAGGEWIEQGEHVVAEGEPEQHKADNGIEKPEKDHVAGHGEEIVEALPERLREIRETYFANVQPDWTINGAIDDVDVGHVVPPVAITARIHDPRPDRA